MNQFEKLVNEMRKAQRAIFLKASPENIKRAQILEHGVDKMLATKQNHPVVQAMALVSLALC